VSTDALAHGPEVTDADLTAADPEAVREALTDGGQWVLRRCDLTEVDLSGVDLGTATLERCTLTRARLRGAILDGAIIEGG
jgi:uncharacterized protein YjbI with pentapeptide repeats